MLIGHEEIVAFFERAKAEGQLAHAYCLAGAEGVGKRTVARNLAASLLGVVEEKLNSQPDYLEVERLVDEKTGKKKTEITVEQVRSLKNRFQNRSWLGGWTVAVVNEAEHFNAESGNALLKTLEEPAAKTIIFLLVNDVESLLPTVRSRCQVFYLPLLSKQKISTGLKARGVENALSEAAADFACGRPGWAIKYATDVVAREEILNGQLFWQKVAGLPLYERFSLINEKVGKKDESLPVREKVEKILEAGLIFWREVLKNKVINSTEQKFSLGTIKNVLENLQNNRKMLSENVNPQMLLEQVINIF